MGLKTIQAKYADARRAHDATLGKFVHDALEVNKRLAEIQKKKAAMEALSKDLGDLYFEASKLLDKLDPVGIKQLADVKHLMKVSLEHPHTPHPINTSELTGLAKAMEKQIELDLQKMMQVYTEKHAASWPSQLKVGMSFKKHAEVIEIIGEEGLDGWKVRVMVGGEVKGDRKMLKFHLSLKNGWKFLKT